MAVVARAQFYGYGVWLFGDSALCSVSMQDGSGSVISYIKMKKEAWLKCLAPFFIFLLAGFYISSNTSIISQKVQRTEQ